MAQEHHSLLRLRSGNHEEFGALSNSGTWPPALIRPKKFANARLGSGAFEALSAREARPSLASPQAQARLRRLVRRGIGRRPSQAWKTTLDVPWDGRRRSKCQSACKPGSVGPKDRSPDVTAIPLGRTLLRASSNQPGRQGPETGPSPLARRASSLFGFAPGGACRAVPVAGSAVRSYRTFSPLPRAQSRNFRSGAVRSLWRFPWGRPRRTLSGTVFPWSPDFPPSQARAAVQPTGEGDMRAGAAGVKRGGTKASAASVARRDRTHFGAIGPVRAAHAQRHVAALIFHDGAAGVAAGHAIGFSEVFHAVARVGLGIE